MEECTVQRPVPNSTGLELETVLVRSVRDKVTQELTEVRYEVKKGYTSYHSTTHIDYAQLWRRDASNRTSLATLRFDIFRCPTNESCPGFDLAGEVEPALQSFFSTCPMVLFGPPGHPRAHQVSTLKDLSWPSQIPRRTNRLAHKESRVPPASTEKRP